jgi:xylose isomerase
MLAAVCPMRSKRFRDALDYLCEYSKAQGYGYKFALEAKPNEPRADIYFATTGCLPRLHRDP